MAAPDEPDRRSTDPDAGLKGHQRHHAQAPDQGGQRLGPADPRPLPVAAAAFGHARSLARLEKPEERDTVGYDYVLRPILFLVPPGAPAATFEARRKEADALRKSFKGCTESIPAVRAMRDVAVRVQVGRSSADLPESLRKVLDSVPLGQLTAARSHAARRRDVCGLLQDRDQDQHARAQQSPPDPPRRALRAGIEEVSADCCARTP